VMVFKASSVIAVPFYLDGLVRHGMREHLEVIGVCLSNYVTII